VWRVIRDELLALVLAFPALMLMVVVGWVQYPEEPVWYRVAFTLVVAMLVVAFIAVSVAAIIYGI